MTIQVKPIKPQKMNLSSMERFLLGRMEKFGQGVINTQFSQTSSTWKSDKPTYEKKTKKSNKGLSLTVGIFKDTKGNRKWMWLNGGTAIRWALMSRDWKSKTKPRKLRSGRGQGNVVIAGRRAMQARNIKPRPGIEERGWIDIIRKKTVRPFNAEMRKAIGDYKLYG